jgi:hypothetical protein
MGRSGTKWLAGILNRDPDWTVLHEPYSGIFAPAGPDGAGDSLARAAVWGRFDSARRYGEVNSQLRYYAASCRGRPGLRVGRQGLLIRCPLEVAESALHRWPQELWSQMLDGLVRDMRILVNLSATGDFRTFTFQDLVSDPSRVDQVAAWAGLRMGLHRPSDAAPVNATRERRFTLKDLSPERRRKLEVRTAKFWRGIRSG